MNRFSGCVGSAARAARLRERGVHRTRRPCPIPTSRSGATNNTKNGRFAARCACDTPDRVGGSGAASPPGKRRKKRHRRDKGAGLHAADFRAAERTYHALLDAAALAKPADEGGMVLIQTSLPGHHAITAVATQNPSLFYEQELLSRQALGYPPFTHLISLQVSGTQAGAVKQAATAWAKLLHQAIPATPKPAPGATEPVTILGPVPAQHAQLRGRHRYQLLVKAGSAEQARQTVKATLDEMERTRGKSGLRFDVDVDPIEML